MSAGLQDERYLPGQGRDQTAVAIWAARRRLATCGTGALGRDLSAIRLPDLAARGAVRAMRSDISGNDRGAVVAIAYRSAATSTRRAQTLEERAMRELDITP